MRRGWLLGAVCALLMVAGCRDDAPPPAPADSASSAPAPTAAQPEVERVRVSLTNAVAGWIPTGLRVAAGDALVLAGTGTVAADGLEFEARHALWYRIGADGDATNLSANVDAITAPRNGEVFVTLRPSGVYWADRAGTYPPGFTEAPAVPIALDVEVLRFAGPLESGLAALAAAGHPADAALATLAARKRLPVGFDYLWNLGRSNVWADGTSDGRPGISADTGDDFGIVKKTVDLPVTEATEFAFDWRYDALPALGPETEAQFHDYLSIAVEFDNGQDLTWLWSTSLPADTHFGCPLPWWDTRETHWVLQSGKGGLGEWHSHKRKVLADYTTSIAVAPPTRIVGVWFIANSLFGRQRAAASFANVTISNGEERVAVFAATPPG